MSKFATIGVAGAGAWGLALANAAAAAGRVGRRSGTATPTRWPRSRGREPARACRGSRSRPPRPSPTTSTRSPPPSAILLVVPAQATRDAAERLAAAFAPRPLIVCAKGIERGSQRFMSEVVAEAAPGWPAAILSGPSFAVDVAAGLPTAVTLASADEALARALAAALSGPNLRLYHSTDPRGVEIGGAAKNVLAIGCGVAAGLGLGASAVAALIARGFAELRRFAAAFGARPTTLMGLSGLGDLVLTCSTAQSRNFCLRPGARARRERRRGERRQAGRRRADRRGADADGAREERRDADLGRGGGADRRPDRRRAYGRRSADAPAQGRGRRLRRFDRGGAIA